MRAAPAVDVALSHGGAERRMIVFLHALAGGALAAWAAAHLDGPASGAALASAVGAVLLAILGGRLAWQALPAAAGCLRWDGTAWSWRARPDGDPLPLGRLVVVLDLGAWVLLQLHPALGGPRRWAVADAPSAGTAWHGLRVALQAHAGAAPLALAAGGPAA